MCIKIKTCIYCKANDITKFTGVEHVIPKAFGTFSSATPTLDCVCDDCNRHFGQNHDKYLARETIEGISRYNKGIFSSEPRPQKHLHITLEDGSETGFFGGMKVTIDGTSGEIMPIKAQFQILNFKTGITEVFFKHQLSDLQLPEDVYGKPGDGKVKGTWEYSIFAPSKEEHEEIVALLQKSGIPFMSGEPFVIQTPTEPDSDGKYTLPVVITGEITNQHRQAHAKIFLNFIVPFLVLNLRLQAERGFSRMLHKLSP